MSRRAGWPGWGWRCQSDNQKNPGLVEDEHVESREAHVLGPFHDVEEAPWRGHDDVAAVRLDGVQVLRAEHEAHARRQVLLRVEIPPCGHLDHPGCAADAALW